MKLGFVSAPTDEKIKFAREAGFDGIEVGVGHFRTKPTCHGVAWHHEA